MNLSHLFALIQTPIITIEWVLWKVWIYKRTGIKGWWVGWYESGKRKAKALPSRKLAEHYCQLKSSDGGVVVLCFTGSSTIDRLRANHIEIRHFLMNLGSFLDKKGDFEKKCEKICEFRQFRCWHLGSKLVYPIIVKVGQFIESGRIYLAGMTPKAVLSAKLISWLVGGKKGNVRMDEKRFRAVACMSCLDCSSAGMVVSFPNTTLSVSPTTFAPSGQIGLSNHEDTIKNRLMVGRQQRRR